MARSANTRKKTNQINFHEDEREILNINYDDTLTTCSFTNLNNFQKNSHNNYLGENVELSLELQIANSLKNIVMSSRNENLSLLDVTIVQPLHGNDYIDGCVENTVALTSSNVKELLEAIDKSEMQKKYKILERHNESECGQYKPQGELNKTPLTKSKSFLDKKMIRKLETHRQKLKRKEPTKYGYVSDPTKKAKCTSKLDNVFRKTNIDLEIKTSSSVTVLKPFREKTRSSFKYLEDSNIMQVGDNLHRYTEKHSKKNYPILIPTKDSYTTADYNSMKFNDREACILNTPQIYAAPKTFDKLKKILECQNPKRADDTDNKNNPCSCQHCELIGVLMDSQKKPFLSSSPATKLDCTKNKHHSNNSKGNTIYRREFQTSEDVRSKHKTLECGSGPIIRELSCRLEALEKRVANQEQLTVPKDYFKRIINKLVNKQLKISPQDSSIVFKSIGTQYYPIEKLEKELKIKRAYKATKYRNVQIQQNDRRNYVVNPVLFQSEVNNSAPLKPGSYEINNINSKILRMKPITAISDYFLKKRESDKKSLNLSSSKTKSSPLENFYRWGEEIIKPGFDLKTKILSLLAEQVESIKNAKFTSYKNINNKQYIASNVSVKPKMSSTSDCKKFQINSKSKTNILHKPSSNDDKQAHPVTSNKTLKKMLNLMSEKIYNEHVKPTVDSIKHEQRSINNDNFSQVFNIKKAMDDVFEKINFNETDMKISNTSNIIKSKSICNREEWRADFLEPLEIPSSIKSNACNSKCYPKTTKIMRKSGIPIRVRNTTTAESISSSNTKFKETNQPNNMEQFQSTVNKSDFKYTTQDMNKIRLHKQAPINKINQQNGSVINPKEEKIVQIKYMNPKAIFWTDESSTSIKIKTSKYNNKVN